MRIGLRSILDMILAAGVIAAFALAGTPAPKADRVDVPPIGPQVASKAP